MNADLVTLSGCNTGGGKYYKGEGIMSIARGFMYSGVSNLVMSLWRVSDEPTRDVMIYFYEEIKKGSSYAEAMRNAKLRYIKESDNVTADPYYWSAFVFIGPPEERGFNIWIWVCVGGATVILATVFLIRRKR